MRAARTPQLLAVMAGLAATAALASPAEAPGGDVVRQLIAEVAIAQVRSIDPAWNEAQRDCAGLVRFAYRTAFTRLRAGARNRPLFIDDYNRPADFADAETLVTRSFVPLGRGDDARHALRSGDLLAFRAERADGEVVWHLMLAVLPAPGTEARVVYHPGEPGARVRTGTLAALAREAPLEWRPSPENPAFLGYFRFRDFAPPAPGGPT